MSGSVFAALRSKARRTALLAAGVSLLALSTAEAADRYALVVGNGAYAAPQHPLPHALNDSRDMAAALRKDGFQVTELQNGAQASMRTALADFAAKLKPGDIAMFYYAGHGVQGPSRASRTVNDDFLLPVDIHIDSADAITRQGLPLSEVLEAFGKAKGGAVLIVLDACRDDPAAGPQGTAGLAWPSSGAARNAFIVFAASPGETAADPPSGEHGLFTGEVLKRMGAPGLSAATLFTEVANAVEKISDPTQRPYFAGSASSAGLVIARGAVTEDAPPLQLAAYRDAVTCGRAECIDFAIARVAVPRLKDDLVKRKLDLPKVTIIAPGEAAGAPQATAPTRSTTKPKTVASAKPKPTIAAPPLKTVARAAPAMGTVKSMPDPVGRFITEHQGTPQGRYEIGKAFLYGREGFPLSWRQAQIWLEGVATTYAPAAFELGTAYENGLGPKRDKLAARNWYLQAGILNMPAGAAHAAYLYDGVGPGSDPKTALTLYRAAAQDGDAFALLALGSIYMSGEDGVKADPKEAVRYYTLAFQHGEPDGYTGIGNCFDYGGCGPKKDTATAIAWFQKAYAAGGQKAAANIARAYLMGDGVKKDLKAAFEWYSKAGARGDRVAMRHLGDFYQDGLGGAPKDEVAAARWYRKSAEAGDPFAAQSLANFYTRRHVPAEAAHWWDEAKALGAPTGILPALFGLTHQ